MPRRDMLGPLTAPNGAENALRQAMASLRNGLRAPARVPAPQVATPTKKAAPGSSNRPCPTGAVISALILNETNDLSDMPASTKTLNATASWANGSRVMLSVFSEASSTPKQPRISADNDWAGLEWKLLRTIVFGGLFRLTMFTAEVNVDPDLGSTITADFAGQSQVAVNMVLDEIDSANGDMSRAGMPCVVQHSKTSVASDDTITGTLKPFSDAVNNGCYVVVAVRFAIADDNVLPVGDLAYVNYSDPDDGATYRWDCVSFFQQGENLAPESTIAPVAATSMAMIAVEISGELTA